MNNVIFTDLEKTNFITGIRNMKNRMNEFESLNNDKLYYCLGIYETLIYNYNLALVVNINTRFIEYATEQAITFVETIKTLINQGKSDKILIDCVNVFEEFIRLSQESNLQTIRFDLWADMNVIE